MKITFIIHGENATTLNIVVCGVYTSTSCKANSNLTAMY